ncbi:hypothetical protein G646_gp003 [Serratia phage phiMAM1]|uniref:Uncharacterized protein n=2 Tax=Miltonvirus MAM1 TaxID=2169689 RepID=K7YIM8_9CAUD|nr:hypothetical protein G646_gp003 [Serratia phage phiMAM1]AFX93471.1 hypothetical protein MAM_003 [Serratia phage phiMAM1]ASZ78769.1 hypothetical protein 2050H1_003 [Serratia phage 2050H1]
MSEFLVYGLGGVIIGFIAGALVFRKHQKDLEVYVQKGQEILDKVETKLNDLKK